MYSSDRDLLEHCGTDCASYEDDKRQQRDQVHTWNNQAISQMASEWYISTKRIKLSSRDAFISRWRRVAPLALPLPSLSDYALNQERYTLDLPVPEYLFTSVL